MGEPIVLGKKIIYKTNKQGKNNKERKKKSLLRVGWLVFVSVERG
jgi:hypothetical protein